MTFFDADPGPRRSFTAYPRHTAGAVAVVRWVWLDDHRRRLRARLELDTPAEIVRAIAYRERSRAHDAALVLFAAASLLAGLPSRVLDARISSALGEDHTQFARPDVAVPASQ